MEERVLFHHIGKDRHFKVWHTLDTGMILYTYSEGGSIVCSEGSYPIHEGTLCFVGAGRYHYTMPDEPDAYDRSKLFISPALLQKIGALLESTELFHRFLGDAFIYAEIPPKARGEAEEIFRAAHRAPEDERGGEAIFLASVLRLLTMLDRYSLQSTLATADVMSRAVEYINSNLFSKLDMDEICAHVHVSKYHFCRAFKKKMGMTVMEYVLKTRIVMAKSMLAKERLSITEISYRCGFSSPAYFSRVFKIDTGITPFQYRRMNSERR